MWLITELDHKCTEPDNFGLRSFHNSINRSAQKSANAISQTLACRAIQGSEKLRKGSKRFLFHGSMLNSDHLAGSYRNPDWKPCILSKIAVTIRHLKNQKAPEKNLFRKTLGLRNIFPAAQAFDQQPLSARIRNVKILRGSDSSIPPTSGSDIIVTGGSVVCREGQCVVFNISGRTRRGAIKHRETERQTDRRCNMYRYKKIIIPITDTICDYLWNFKTALIRCDLLTLKFDLFDLWRLSLLREINMPTMSEVYAAGSSLVYCTLITWPLLVTVQVLVCRGHNITTWIQWRLVTLTFKLLIKKPYRKCMSTIKLIDFVGRRVKDFRVHLFVYTQHN